MTATRTISIDGRIIGDGHPPYVVAEISGNHGGELSRALEIIEVAKDCGADAVKFQTYTPDTITIDCARPEFFVHNPLWSGKTLYELYTEAHTPYEWHEALFQKARQIGITAFSSPFDSSAVHLLETLNCPAYKIASSELVDVNLIRQAAKVGKPIIMSTGMATFDEVKEALRTCEETGNSQVCLLHCIAGYPTPTTEAHLNTIEALRRYGFCVGLSDHSSGTAVAVAAVAKGVCLIEKHFCLSREHKTVDGEFSLDPVGLKQLVITCSETHSMLGEIQDGSALVEQSGRQYRRSLYAVQDIRAGDVFSEENIRSIRPANGLHPRYLNRLLGTRSDREIQRGEPLSEADLK